MWWIFILLTVGASLGPHKILKLLGISHPSRGAEIFLYLLLYLGLFLFAQRVLGRKK